MDIVWNHFIRLYREKNQLALLAWAYGIISVIAVIIAGLVALIDQSVGKSILFIPLISACAFCANIVMWAIIRLILDAYASYTQAKIKAAKEAERKAKRVAAKSTKK